MLIESVSDALVALVVLMPVVCIFADWLNSNGRRL